MFIPDVINTLLMGLIFMVIVVTVVRPFVLHIVNGAMSTEDLQKEAIEAVQQEMMRASQLAEARRNEQIRFQQLLLEVPEKLKPKAPPEIEEEDEEEPVEIAEAAPQEDIETPVEEGVEEAAAEAATEEGAEEEATEEAAADSNEIVMQEGETLAEQRKRQLKKRLLTAMKL